MRGATTRQRRKKRREEAAAARFGHRFRPRLRPFLFSTGRVDPFHDLSLYVQGFNGESAGKRMSNHGRSYECIGCHPLS